jgi:hypothetical protein
LILCKNPGFPALAKAIYENLHPIIYDLRRESYDRRKTRQIPMSFPTAAEIDQFRQSPAADPGALQLLEQTQDFEAAFNQIYLDRFGTTPLFGDKDPSRSSLWQILLKRIQGEICGEDDSFRSLIQAAKKNPGNATLITGAITALVNLSGIPLPIDSAIATAIALYILHIGIDVFCEWATPTPQLDASRDDS